jgi:hypothetical protein
MGLGEQYFSDCYGDSWGPERWMSGRTDAKTVFDPGGTNFRGELYLAWRSYSDEALNWGTAGSGGNYEIRSHQPVGYRSHTAPKLATFRDLMYMAYRGENGDEHLYWITFDGTNWDKHWMDYRSEVGPTLGVAGDRLYMAYKGESGDSAVYYTYME